MVHLQDYKFVLKTNAGQCRELGRFAGCRRFVWNNGLALPMERHKAGEKRLGSSALCKALTARAVQTRQRAAPSTSRFRPGENVNLLAKID